MRKMGFQTLFLALPLLKKIKGVKCLSSLVLLQKGELLIDTTHQQKEMM